MQLSKITHIKYKRFLFTVNDCFLTQPNIPDADINYYIQCTDDLNNTLTEFYTLLIDLKKPIEEIWNNIYHRTQSEILSFTRNQSFEHKILFNLSKDELIKFTKLFNSFAKYKGIRPLEYDRLKAYNTHGILAVSYIMQNNQFICVNFYRVTHERSANLYSFHLKHYIPEMYSASHFGRAHRTLHWLDIIEFKKLGVNFYDFCGWYNGLDNKDLLNINKFKEQFTTFKIKEYSGVFYKNKLLRFFKMIK